MSAPKHDAVRARLAARDAVTAKKPGIEGAAARFRQQHGNICDFLMSEGARDDNDDDASGVAAAGYGPNFHAAIVQCAVNSGDPMGNAKAFLEWLADAVITDIERLQSGDTSRAGSYVEVQIGSGEIRDYDVLNELKRK
jgi:hypothetical protein